MACDTSQSILDKHSTLHKQRRTLKDLLGFSNKTSPIPEKDVHVRRLGRAELGPHANEERMPARVLKQLEHGAKIEQHHRFEDDGTTFCFDSISNEVSGIVNVLVNLCENDQSVATAYLCHPVVQHVHRTRWEGFNFCGYRNVQMLTSYIRGAKGQGYEKLPACLPTVLEIQDLIEEAWDQGINEQGRVETGGIRGTRKHIGTQEAQAMFRGLGIGCRAGVYHDTTDGPRAWESLLAFAMLYFASASSVTASDDINGKRKVHQTLMPPIYLQRPRHSLTIIGVERRTDGSVNLLVFDPDFGPSRAMMKILASVEKSSGSQTNMNRLGLSLGPYRRGKQQLQRFKDFETLMLTDIPHQP